MQEEVKRPGWAIAISLLFSLLAIASGIYVLLEKKFIISGKLTGHLYHFNENESWLVAISFFLVAAFLILFISKNKRMKTAGEWLLGIAIVVFLSSAFVSG